MMICVISSIWKYTSFFIEAEIGNYYHKVVHLILEVSTRHRQRASAANKTKTLQNMHERPAGPNKARYYRG